jgi:phosphatidylserine/phosphatidylglycerophosphate/cardiolipin synthase-like enzyme
MIADMMGLGKPHALLACAKRRSAALCCPRQHPRATEISMRQLFIAALLLTTAALPAAADHPVELEEVCFTPGGECTDVVVATIAGAKRQVLVQAYSFTSQPIAKALVDASMRGVDVRAILDKSQRSEKYSGADYLANSGVPVQIDSVHAIAHNKVMVIDEESVITGSFNFTKSAQGKNAENLIMLRDPELARVYADNWKIHSEHSEAYAGRGVVNLPETTPEPHALRQCTHGIPCGGGCISALKICRK